MSTNGHCGACGPPRRGAAWRAELATLVAAKPWPAAAHALLAHLGGARRILVAASGGPDSQALLAWSAVAAPQLGLCHLGAVGIDHGLRPQAAGELALAAELAGGLGLPWQQVDVVVPRTGNRLAAARSARNQALAAHAEAVGAQAILLGHQQDDLAETMLWHLLRGSAAACQTAMPARSGPFVRPLLGVPRHTLLALLAAAQVPFATDPTNAQPGRMRATLRAQIWPAIEAAWPDAKAHLCQGLAPVRQAAAREGRFVARVLRLVAGQRAGRAALCLPAWRRLRGRVGQEVVRSWLLAAGVRPDARQLKALAHAVAAPQRAGQQLACASLPGGTLLWREPHLLVGTPQDFAPRQRRAPRAERPRRGEEACAQAPACRAPSGAFDAAVDAPLSTQQ